MAVLDAVAGGGVGSAGVGVSTVAQRTGLPKSTAQRLLRACWSGSRRANRSDLSARDPPDRAG
ncbi:helix-turn-helix domain-containing protein [Pseudonocardia sp. RS010]|uniref:helix-turn-helix domain-containing protein n=1 Tax=Pseudonocardia sp. RS010 TaxID=3385979 RepID=UPI0039A17C12